MPSNALITGGFAMPSVRGGLPVAPASSLRARIRSHDGRVLISHATPSSALAWLTDSTSAGREPLGATVFTVSFAASSALWIRNRSGECLTATPNESFIPLAFGKCDRESLWTYPPVDAAIAAGQTGFWILSRMGTVGPDVSSSLLMPWSSLRVWFRLEPVQ